MKKVFSDKRSRSQASVLENYMIVALAAKILPD